jgi:hypothetical protein
VPIAVVTPVGPGAVDAERAWDNVRSMSAWEPQVRWIVFIDDSGPGEERDLAAVDVDGIQVVSIPSPLSRGEGSMHERVASASMAGLGWVANSTDADIAMIIDTDALVIAPFADKLTAAFSEDETIGLLGSFDRTCNGDPRDFGSWSGDVQQLARIVQRPRRIAVAGRARRVRQLVLEAREAGYEWGEHALGCALAVRRAALDEWREDGVLDDPLLFTGTNLSYDPIMGILVRRSGYREAGMVDDGEPFGLLWQGLPDTLERLVERGFSIVHSTKNDPRYDEETVRAFFRARRPVGDGSPRP